MSKRRFAQVGPPNKLVRSPTAFPYSYFILMVFVCQLLFVKEKLEGQSFDDIML